MAEIDEDIMVSAMGRRAIGNQAALWFMVPGLPSIVLIGASVAKVYYLAVNPLYHLQAVGSRWMTLGVAEVELLLGTWLLSGIAWRWARRAGVSCYAIFAAVNVVQIAQGEASCGCLPGVLETSPSYMLAFDVLALVALAIWGPKVGSCRKADFVFSGKLTASLLLLTMMPVAIVLAAGLVFAGAEGAGLSMARIVVLEPDTWVGETVPILTEIQTSYPIDFSAGDWILILFDPNCHECQDFIKKAVPMLRTQKLSKQNSKSIAFVEVSRQNNVEPGETNLLTTPGEFYIGWLRTDIRWFVKLPVAILVSNGKAIAAADTPGRISEWVP